jgi:UDP-N-acetylmuramoyl-tripeptide--D-alanyl-D-alanine ligase
MKPISLEQLATLISATAINDVIVRGICVDSRLTQPGDLFFALPGAQTDGHAYLAEVASKGAVAAIVSKNYAGDAYGLPLIHSEDVLRTLQLLAKKILCQRKTKIVAVTGSLGKTTTKDFITTLLKKKYRVNASPGNRNSQIGLPLAILNHTTGEEEVLILEMGMTHAGEISTLIEIAPPEIAVITTVALVHACNFDSIADIARAKAEIFSHDNTRLGIFNHDMETNHLIRLSGKCPKLSYSVLSPNADFFLQDEGNRLKIRDSRGETAYFDALALPGAHNTQNFLAAVAVARCLGLTWEEIYSMQGALTLPERRLQMIKKNEVLFVNDSYNASEISLKSALSAMPEPNPGGRKIAVIGEMLELGKFSETCHRNVGEYALQRVDLMLCLGKECAPIYECWQAAHRPVIWKMERSELVSALQNQIKPGDVVLLKGSQAKALWKILEEL